MKRLVLILFSLSLFLVIWAGSAHAQQHFTPMATTGGHYDVVIQSGQLNDIVPLEAGADEIGLFTLDTDGTEICVGMRVVTDTLSPGTGPLGILAYEDDTNTSIKDGYTFGDPIIVRVWDNSMSQEYVAIVAFAQGDGTYGSGLYSVVSTLTTTAAIPTVGEWGMIFLGLTMLVTGAWFLRTRKGQTAPTMA